LGVRPGPFTKEQTFSHKGVEGFSVHLGERGDWGEAKKAGAAGAGATSSLVR